MSAITRNNAAANAAAAASARAAAAASNHATQNRVRIAQQPTIVNQRNYIHFFAEISNGSDHGGAYSTSFDVLAGDTKPQVTDGYAQLSTIALPLGRGITQFQGYNPTSMSIPIRFIKLDRQGSWLRSNKAGNDLETDIRKLEWMAGQGFSSGQPPVVFLTTFDNHGRTTPLIPLQYQSDGVSGSAHAWLISGVQWGDSDSNKDMYRTRQDATVTVQARHSVTGSYTDLLPRAKATTVVSKTGSATALEIARSVPTANAPQLAYDIVHAAQNAGLRLRGINQRIKHGRHVYVPSSAAQAGV